MITLKREYKKNSYVTNLGANKKNKYFFQVHYRSNVVVTSNKIQYNDAEISDLSLLRKKQY